jgi:hypothetical protein
MKLSPSQMVSSDTSWTEPIGATLGMPAFDAVAMEKILFFENTSFISAVSLTIHFTPVVLPGGSAVTLSST